MTSHYADDQNGHLQAALGIPSNVLARRKAAYDADQARRVREQIRFALKMGTITEPAAVELMKANARREEAAEHIDIVAG
jgi:hypothetical protein